MHSFRIARAYLTLAFCAATAISALSQTFISRPIFTGLNGAQPNSPMVQGFDGNFYGTTVYGGPSFTKKNYGHGTIFKQTSTGVLTTLYNFCSQVVHNRCADGQTPESGLILARDGNFYGTTLVGGANGDGTFFRITPSGKLTTIYSFCSSSCPEGVLPGGVIQGTDGNFYGTTTSGGANGNGTAFSITAAGVLTVLHAFNYLDEGIPSYYPLLQANDGNFYGVAPNGPEGGCLEGCGTIFRLSPEGNVTTLYTFCSLANCADGYSPEGALIQGSDGNLYGTTVLDNVTGGGTVFKLTLGGQLTTLYRFCSLSNCLDGFFPGTGVAQGNDGNFYGTTEGGGSYGGGEMFKLTPGGAFTVLYSFCSQTKCPDGEEPTALLQSTDGNFYGGTNFGGDVTDCPTSGLHGCGDSFFAGVGLRAFVQPNPAFGQIGWTVDILGNHLTGATSVTFNGTPATFTVVSKTHITATVPVGATTGAIKVSIPGKTLTSKVSFRILP